MEVALTKTFAIAALALAACTLTACGRAGPTAAQADAALHQALAAHKRELVRRVGTREADAMWPKSIPSFTVTAISCSRGGGGVFICATTGRQGGETHTKKFEFVRVPATWAVVSPSSPAAG